MNEAELAERCGKGDNLARKQLYERYAGQLMAICIRYIGDRETAQDVLHDGFLNIFRSFDTFIFKHKMIATNNGTLTIKTCRNTMRNDIFNLGMLFIMN